MSAIARTIAERCTRGIVLLEIVRQSGLRESLLSGLPLPSDLKQCVFSGSEASSSINEILAEHQPAAAVVSASADTERSAKRLIRALRSEEPDLPILLAIDCSKPEVVVDLCRLGVDDFVTPPFSGDSVLPRLLRLFPSSDAAHDETMKRASVKPIPGLVGSSAAFLAVVDQVRAFSGCDATVLIEGETGTGKGLCALALHRLSDRRDRPFSAINCGALPHELVENELFGHKRAAFTGASSGQLGLIADSEGGSLFFDEIDSLPLPVQAKLLRFVQDHEYRPLGGRRVLQADVRLMAATNIDLEAATSRGDFRQDLYYRLDILRLGVPPLRQRLEDISELVPHFLERFRRKMKSRARRLSIEAMEVLLRHDWPGNVRELEHVVQRAVALGHGERVLTHRHVLVGRSAEPFEGKPFAAAKKKVVEEFERSYIMAYLAAFGGNITRAATAAGKNRRAFWELMRKYSIAAEDFKAETGADPPA